MIDNEPESTGDLLNQRAKRVQAWRDLAIAAGGLLYLLGYLSWAFHSWKLGRGLLPPLEGQYLVAGLIPLVILLAVGLLFGRFFPWLRRGRTPSARGEPVRKWMNGVGIVLFLLGFVAGRLEYATADSALKAVGFGLLLLSQLLALNTESRIDRVFLRYTYWYLFGVAPLLTMVSLVIYVDRIFPTVPAEFGGPRPRCVRLDVSSEQLSDATRARLGTPSGAASGTQQTAPTWLVYEGGGFVILSPQRQPGTYLRVMLSAIHSIQRESRCASS